MPETSNKPSPAAAKNKPSPAVAKNLRSNSNSFTLLDIQNLIAESEARIIKQFNKRFDDLSERVASIEHAISEVKAVQVQQENDMDNIKTIIVAQQRQIEAFEERERKCNLVISNLPETSVEFDSESLADDESKTLALFNAILPPHQKLAKEQLDNVTRLGRYASNDRPRLLKIRLPDVKCRNDILHNCRNLNSTSILSSFGRIHVNKDMSYLRRQEEKRLRSRMKQLKSAYPEASVRLKNGTLFLGQAVKDNVDFRNTLF